MPCESKVLVTISLLLMGHSATSRTRVRFWIVIRALVIVFFATATWILNRIASPPVTTVVSRPPWDWRTFVSTEEGFSITFPSKPKVRSETTTNRAGVMFVRQYYSEVD